MNTLETKGIEVLELKIELLGDLKTHMRLQALRNRLIKEKKSKRAMSVLPAINLNHLKSRGKNLLTKPLPKVFTLTQKNNNKVNRLPNRISLLSKIHTSNPVGKTAAESYTQPPSLANQSTISNSRMSETL
jgi:hypothetical protein